MRGIFFLLLFCSQLIAAQPADPPQLWGDLATLVESGYRTARGESAGVDVEVSARLATALGDATAANLTLAVKRPSEEGAQAWRELSSETERVVVTAETIERGHHSPVLSVVIVRVAANDHVEVAAVPMGEKTVPLRLGEVLSPSFRERPSEGGIVMLGQREAVMTHAMREEIQRLARKAATAVVDRQAMLAKVAERDFSFVDALYVNAVIFSWRKWHEPATGDPGLTAVIQKTRSTWMFEQVRRDPFLRMLAYRRAENGSLAEEYLVAISRLWSAASGGAELSAIAELMTAPAHGLSSAPEHVIVIEKVLARLLRRSRAFGLHFEAGAGLREGMLAFPDIAVDSLRELAADALVSVVDGDAAQLALSWLRDGKHADAADFLHNALSRFPRAFTSARVLSMALVQMGRAEAARQVLGEALERDPEPPQRAELHSAAAKVALITGDELHAATHLRAALEADPVYEPALISLAQLEQRAGRDDIAKQIAKRLLESHDPRIREAAQRIIVGQGADSD